ncbi:MAG: hydantoinase B/oxoprolinase family protein [Myxococcota bacterium]
MTDVSASASVSGSVSGWEFWIDRGGTFTDCVALDPDGGMHWAKQLSSDTAPVEVIRQILERADAVRPGDVLPACLVKSGSTLATNALLERRGVPTGLVANRGLSGVFEIRTQQRPDLFALDIRCPAPVHALAIEIPGRVDAEGAVLEAFDPEAVRTELAKARRAGVRSIAVALIHAYSSPEFERQAVAIAREEGFEYAVSSHEVARELGLLARGETAAVDAYLTPLLREHVEGLQAALPGSVLRFMQSSGGLASAERYRGPTALLSGPAGGVVAAARVAREAGFDRALTFDMGGTSTDVSLVRGATPEATFESEIGGVRVLAPMLRIHTVAAGGGSRCRFDGFRQSVGPESTGADPGPLCYGRASGDSTEHEPSGGLALTDVNYFLGRIQGDRFPFTLSQEPVVRALEAVQAELAAAGFERDLDAVAAGFVEVANANMAQAIQRVSVARGADPRDFVLVGFGGAGGQHVCALARTLSIRRVLLHPLAGLLSAYGIGVAEARWDRSRDVGRVHLPRDSTALPESLVATLAELEASGRSELAEDGVSESDAVWEHFLDLRYAGTDTALSILCPPAEGTLCEAFLAEHQQRFGYCREDRAIEIVTARVRGRGAPRAVGFRPESVGVAAKTKGASPKPLRYETIWFPDVGRQRVPIYAREDLRPGFTREGPFLVLEATGTVAVDPGFRARVEVGGLLILETDGAAMAAKPDPLEEADPVRLEVFGNRFMALAEQMGAVLRNTAVSTNIKDRLDYSCAVFDAEGGLIANAPHIPVHLGAMQETVRAVRERFPELLEGEAVATNDPLAGGSHLPDVTLVTPVFLDSARPVFFVASRGHHADIGGRTPGSMPPDSRSLEEEGVVLEPFRLLRGGVFDAEELARRLGAGRFPARCPDDNRADLEAMVAANRAGSRWLAEFVTEVGRERVEATTRQLQRAAGEKVAAEIAKLRDGEHRFEDRMDDGTPVCVTLRVRGDRMQVDFEGTGPPSPTNLNAPRAVVHAAVLYVLRALVNEAIPLNGGCLQPVEITIPPNSLLDPAPGAAVVGGNVETSQRIVDVLLGALGRAAASQGTMNNVTFGNQDFAYYETLGGGAGAGPDFEGASGVHTHMTNTRITDAEILEVRFPVRLIEFGLRAGSGGAGRTRGGDGVVRTFEFTAPVTVSLLAERRETAPFGLEGGEPGQRGRHWAVRNGEWEALPGHCSIELSAGDRLGIETPGGGGFGRASGLAADPPSL